MPPLAGLVSYVYRVYHHFIYVITSYHHFISSLCIMTSYHQFVNHFISSLCIITSIREVELDRNNCHEYFSLSAAKMDMVIKFVGPLAWGDSTSILSTRKWYKTLGKMCEGKTHNYGKWVETSQFLEPIANVGTDGYRCATIVSCCRYLLSVKPLLTEAEYSHTKTLVEDLQRNEGPKLQQYLLNR